jgi:hypothetical protein
MLITSFSSFVSLFFNSEGHETDPAFRPSFPPPCRERREPSRLNPSGGFADLDRPRLSPGLGCSRARDGNRLRWGLRTEIALTAKRQKAEGRKASGADSFPTPARQNSAPKMSLATTLFCADVRPSISIMQRLHCVPFVDEIRFISDGAILESQPTSRGHAPRSPFDGWQVACGPFEPCQNPKPKGTAAP